jgi:hypothetical protein
VPHSAKSTLAMRVRDRLGEVFADEPFTAARPAASSAPIPHM